VGAPYEARIQDISAGGAFVLSDRTVAFREGLVLTLFPRDGATAISVDCEVVHAMQSGFGVEFNASTPPDVRNVIDDWLCELSGRPVPPRAPSRPAPASASAPPAEKTPKPAAPKILLVQHDRQLARMLIGLLEKAGAEVVGVHEATTLQGTLDRERFHLAVIDWLPTDEVPEGLMQAIRGRSRKLPIVVVSTQATSPDFRARAVELGATELVKKPFQLKELIATLESLLSTR
jgi:CheY-like chemotaxis protein